MSYRVTVINKEIACETCWNQEGFQNDNKTSKWFRIDNYFVWKKLMQGIEMSAILLEVSFVNII